jgi:membrane dipeptidase
MRRCAATGGVVNINGFGIFLGNNDNSTETLLRHIEYVAALIGPEHVGLGLDYVFDQAEMVEYVRARPDIFPPDKGYGAEVAMVEPERLPVIAEELLKRGYREEEVRGILGGNNFRVAVEVWK